MPKYLRLTLKGCCLCDKPAPHICLQTWHLLSRKQTCCDTSGICALSAFSLPVKTCFALSLITCQLISQSFFFLAWKKKTPTTQWQLCTGRMLQLWPADGCAAIFCTSGLRHPAFFTAAALSRCSLCLLFEIWARTSRPLLTVPALAPAPPPTRPVSLGTLQTGRASMLLTEFSDIKRRKKRRFQEMGNFNLIFATGVGLRRRRLYSVWNI